MIPEPETASATVWLLATALDAVAVTVMMVWPVSEPVVLLSERLTAGVAGVDADDARVDRSNRVSLRAVKFAVVLSAEIDCE